MTPPEREARRQREIDAIFQLGWDSGDDDPPLTDEQIAHLAFVINPRVAVPRDHAPAALPQAA